MMVRCAGRFRDGSLGTSCAPPRLAPVSGWNATSTCRTQVRAMAAHRRGGKKKGGGGKSNDAAADAAGEDASATSAAAAAVAAASGARLRLLERVEARTEVKKSRFVATAAPVDTPEEAMRFFAEAGDPGASHNCFAYKIGQQHRFSDDGEPGGTAGRPMLSAIEGSGFDGVAVLVTRYYGGVQLGAGGLVRAYGGAAAKSLDGAPGALAYPKVDAVVTAPDFAALGAVYLSMEAFGAEKEDEEFCDDGSVHVQIRVEKEKATAMGEAIRDATNGRAEYRVLDD